MQNYYSSLILFQKLNFKSSFSAKFSSALASKKNHDFCVFKLYNNSTNIVITSDVITMRAGRYVVKREKLLYYYFVFSKSHKTFASKSTEGCSSYYYRDTHSNRKHKIVKVQNATFEEVRFDFLCFFLKIQGLTFVK